MVAAIVLAAGASSRMGQPKALLQLAGRTCLEWVVSALGDSGVQPIHVVVGAERDRIAAAVPPPATTIANLAWQRGRTGSVKTGLRQVPLDEEVLVWPVDHPLASAGTVRTLLKARGAEIRVPVHDGRRGHPTLFSARMRPEILALADDQPLRDVLHRDEKRVLEVPVDDPGVLLNLDTPDDLKKADTYLRGLRDARPPP